MMLHHKLPGIDLRPRLPRISAATLVISGAHDLAAPVEHQRPTTAAIPQARHEVVSPAAQVVAVERPRELNHLIRERPL